MRKWRKVIEYAIELNKKEQNYPVWGTCLGYEALIYAFSDYKISTSEVDTLNKNKKLNWNKKIFKQSLIGKELRTSVAESLEKSKKKF